MKRLTGIYIKLTTILFLAIAPVCGVIAQPVVSKAVSEQFEAIRNNEAMLQFFFTRMPKGGDLHNHLTGSVYAETYFDIACERELFLNTETFILSKDSIPPATYVHLRKDMENLHSWRVKCIDHWSIRNFETGLYAVPPDEFFFNTFGAFGTATSDLERFLKELRVRAVSENVSYLEIMAASPKVDSFIGDYDTMNNQLIQLIREKKEPQFWTLLSEIYQKWETDKKVEEQISNYVKEIENMHIKGDTLTEKVVSRYQAYAGRNAEPIKVFAQLYIGYKATLQSDKIVGVNIVQAENGEISIRDYWGHMRMFKYLNSVTRGKVATSMHAGELTIGLIPPEDLQFHITEAVMTGGAKRIGHGVDIPFERSTRSLLSYMKDRDIPVEINLTSNEFILGVKNDSHPIILYKRHEVPFVLSTDDPGILRTNLSQQFVIAALRYPELKYSDFKDIIRNSIQYSFLNQVDKNRLIDQLEQDLDIFEREIPDEMEMFLLN